MFMKKAVCELFAGVGGFRCGLNHISDSSNKQEEKWNTVWFNQWEPAEKTTQYAHDCYVYNFGKSIDLEGKETTNINIEDVDKSQIPDFNLLVGGFPCQDYSVASTLHTSKGLEGKKGVLWWSIRDTIEEKKPPFVLLENVDRLIKSPAKQRGRDFGVMLTCLRDQGYNVEWRVINAAEYGYQQRRRRVFIFAFKDDTIYSQKLFDANINLEQVKNILNKTGFFAKTFKIKDINVDKIKCVKIPIEIGEVSNEFTFDFMNSGIMIKGEIFTVKTQADYNGEYKTLGDILETEPVDESFFIPEEKLYYTNPSVKSSNEVDFRLSKEDRKTWQYLKGGKKLKRTSKNGHEYVFSEGAISLIDKWDKPARTMLTSEGSFSRTTHVVKDKITGRLRLLTPTETERIQGFPTNHTKYCLTDDKVVNMPDNKRKFMMGNALVVNLIEDMERTLSKIFEEEDTDN